MLFPKQTFLNQLFERAQLFFCYSKLHLVLHLRRDGHDSLGCAPHHARQARKLHA